MSHGFPMLHDFLFLNIVKSLNVTARTLYSPLNVFVSLSNHNYFSIKIMIGKS